MKKISKAPGVLETIKCGFNIFNEDRKYSGHHRKYLLDAARQVCYAPQTREAIKNREKVGYFGHGQRVLLGKLEIEETEVAELKDGSKLLMQNVPSNVTTSFEIDQQGNVDHTQDILDTEPGRIVSALNRSHVGGFSWAMGQGAPGAVGVTRVTSFAGFDYVMNPGFNKNRGYVLESAFSRSTVLESIEQSGVDGQTAEAYLAQWASSANFEVRELKECLRRQSFEMANLYNQIKDIKKRGKGSGLNKFAGLNEKNSIEAAESCRAMALEAARNCCISVPGYVLEAMARATDENDFRTVMDFVQQASKVNLNRWPVRTAFNTAEATSDAVSESTTVDYQYGSIEAGLALAVKMDKY